MPNYTNNALAKLVRDNSQVYFWQNEIVNTGTLSIAYQLERINRSFYPWGASVEVVFAGAPGGFEVDIMVANNDNAANYVSIGTIVAVNAFNVGRFDMPTNIWPKFIAVFVKTLGNPVALTAQLTR